MMRACIYTRFSPRRNAEKCESCQAQEKICRDWADEHGADVYDVVDDPDVSGKDEYRPNLFRAIEGLRRGDVLLVWKRDRLARNVYLAEMINRAVEKRGATIKAVEGDVEGDTPEAVMVRQIVAAMAQYERACISSRTSAIMRTHQANGRRMSAITPYGWRRDPQDPTRMVPDETERVAVEAIRAMKDEGLGLMQITRVMNRDHQGAARCGHWSAKVVRSIMMRI